MATKRGRPRIGDLAKVRLPDDIMAEVDQIRDEIGDDERRPSRAEVLRVLIVHGLRSYRPQIEGEAVNGD